MTRFLDQRVLTPWFTTQQEPHKHSLSLTDHTAGECREGNYKKGSGVFASIDKVRVDISGIIVTPHTLGKSPPCR